VIAALEWLNWHIGPRVPAIRAGKPTLLPAAIAAIPGSRLNHFIPGAANSIVYIFLAQFKQFLMIWLITPFRVIRISKALRGLSFSAIQSFGI
jgi:hypothetical protein